ncbi:MAG: phenylacetic acid degradation operon negative regulatory protein PaaX [Pseudomonadota bacterium]
MSLLKTTSILLEAFREQRPLRGGSLIITVFGDAISQHGNSVWLGSIIQALEPFGLNSRLIRTAVHRLVQEDWLQSEQVGRRSYYSFTDAGLRRYEKAARRIYAGSAPDWDGTWSLLICNKSAEAGREQLRKELSWLGYGAINSNILLHAGSQSHSLKETLEDMGLSEQVVVLDASTTGFTSEQALKELARECWPLEDLAKRYEAFLAQFKPVQKTLTSAAKLCPEQAFQLRTLLVHEYRRILLRDSDLPARLLPSDWAGHRALTLVATIYREIESAAELYIRETMETTAGGLPAAIPAYKQRFGGL